MNERKHQDRKRATYLAGHQAGWVAALTLMGLDPDKFRYTPPTDRREDVRTTG